MTRRLSLRLRLTLLAALLTGGTVLLFALLFYFVLRANLLGEIDRRLQERADLVTASLQVVSDKQTSSNDLLVPTSLVEFDAPGIYVEVITPNGSVRARSPNLPPDSLSSVAPFIPAARRQPPVTGTVPAGDDDQLRFLVTTVQVGGQAGDVLIVAESLEPFLRTLAQARELLFLCGALALALAVGGATLLTGRSLAPISRLTQAAASIAATGHYNERVPLPRRRDEIGQLAATINDLIARVEQVIEQQRQFLADTSHELRSPLTVILANLNLLRRDLDRRERELSVAEATAEAQRMRRLVNDLLLLAQSDTTQVIAHAPVRLDRLVEETVAMAARQTREHPMQARVQAPVIVNGDRERLTQLLRNLLENAIHHTPAGTPIEVCLSRSDAVAQIAVADSGPGIAQEHLGQIWDRFYRVDKARSRAFGDGGLGLAIVKYIAEAHGGAVRVVSAEGQGTTFTITLPLVSGAA
ncbi:MAG TPA: HAMP domain-containing sensor histidine kinase [Roseiflexaceae bacterium]